MKTRIEHKQNKVGQFFDVTAPITPADIFGGHIQQDFQNLITIGAKVCGKSMLSEYTDVSEIIQEEQNCQDASITAFKVLLMLQKLNGSAKLALDDEELPTFESLVDSVTELLCKVTKHQRELTTLIHMLAGAR